MHYDLEEPERYPEELRGTVDIAIADPPFLNEVRGGVCRLPLLIILTPATQVTNRYFATTLRSLLKPDGKLILLTSTSVSSILPKVYDSPPVGPLRKTSLQVEHAGGRLQNDFGGWSNLDFDEREGVKSLEQL